MASEMPPFSLQICKPSLSTAPVKQASLRPLDLSTPAVGRLRSSSSSNQSDAFSFPISGGQKMPISGGQKKKKKSSMNHSQRYSWVEVTKATEIESEAGMYVYVTVVKMIMSNHDRQWKRVTYAHQYCCMPLCRVCVCVCVCWIRSITVKQQNTLSQIAFTGWDEKDVVHQASPRQSTAAWSRKRGVDCKKKASPGLVTYRYNWCTTQPHFRSHDPPWPISVRLANGHLCARQAW